MVRDRRNRANPPGNYIYGFTRVSRHMACCLVHSMMVATPEFGSSNHLVILNALGFRQPTRPGCGRFGTSYPLVVRLAARLYKWNIWKKQLKQHQWAFQKPNKRSPWRLHRRFSDPWFAADATGISFETLEWFLVEVPAVGWGMLQRWRVLWQIECFLPSFTTIRTVRNDNINY
jgi:hypothetical protein